MNKKKYLCSECPRSFFKETSFQSHVSYHKRISLGHKVVKKAILKPYECRICEVTLLGRLNYVSHCKTVHGAILPRSEIIICKTCKKKWNAPNFYIKHHQEAHGSLPPEYQG